MDSNHGQTLEGNEVTAAEIRKKFELSYSTINHYTNLGLFSVLKKNGNKRIYDFDEVKARYLMITKLTKEGYPLGLIQKKIMGLMRDELL